MELRFLPALCAVPVCGMALPWDEVCELVDARSGAGWPFLHSMRLQAWAERCCLSTNEGISAIRRLTKDARAAE